MRHYTSAGQCRVRTKLRNPKGARREPVQSSSRCVRWVSRQQARSGVWVIRGGEKVRNGFFTIFANDPRNSSA